MSEIKHRILIATFTALVYSLPASAHHGFGLFEMNKDVEYSGTLTRMELVNPHSYMYIDTVDAGGKSLSVRCEMRAATLIKRSGWSVDMFVIGSHVDVQGHPHRTDPHSCYVETFTLGDKPAINRNDQFTNVSSADASERPSQLPSGEPNISGDWAVELGVLTVPPGGGTGEIVPKSLRGAFAAGDISIEEIRALNPRPAPPVYTPVGQAAAKAFRNRSPEDNPRLACKATSIIFDWTFDWPVNRISQTTVDGKKVIDIDYGLYSLSRRIHMDMAEHPKNIKPSNAGHSIGHWEGNTLIVDTIGFESGVLVPPTRNSDQLHIVERFIYDPNKPSIRREYTVEDPVYLAAPYTGADTVFISETPYEKQTCKELTYEYADGK